jgi:hypothetical protein
VSIRSVSRSLTSKDISARHIKHSLVRSLLTTRKRTCMRVLHKGFSVVVKEVIRHHKESMALGRGQQQPAASEKTALTPREDDGGPQAMESLGGSGSKQCQPSPKQRPHLELQGSLSCVRQSECSAQLRAFLKAAGGGADTEAEAEAEAEAEGGGGGRWRQKDAEDSRVKGASAAGEGGAESKEDDRGEEYVRMEEWWEVAFGAIPKVLLNGRRRDLFDVEMVCAK